MIRDFRLTGSSAGSFGALKFGGIALVLSTLNFQLSTLHAFEGRIAAVLTRGGETQTLFYSVGTNRIRIERGETDWPHAKNIVDRDTGATTILFPHNRSFVRLKSTMPADRSLANPSGVPAPPSVPDGAPAFPGSPTARSIIGPTNLSRTPAPPAMPQLPPGVGPQAGPGPGALPMPALPMVPPMPMERAELKATDQTTNLLGLPCTRYELKQRGEVVEIWATDKLIPFQPYLQNQPHRFGPPIIEEQWGEALKAKKIFPLLAIWKIENGPERMRFEVRSVTPEKIKQGDEEKLFQPPPDYQEMEPLPF